MNILILLSVSTLTLAKRMFIDIKPCVLLMFDLTAAISTIYFFRGMCIISSFLYVSSTHLDILSVSLRFKPVDCSLMSMTLFSAKQYKFHPKLDTRISFFVLLRPGFGFFGFFLGFFFGFLGFFWIF